LRNLVHVLGLVHNPKLLATELLEILLKGRTPKVLDDMRPFGRFLMVAEVELDLPRENFERRGLSYAVLSQETEHNAGGRRGQTEEFECVRAESVAALLFEFVWEVHYGESLERALSDADAAAHAEGFNDNWLVVFEADGFNLASNRGAETVAHSTAALDIASVFLEDGYSDHSVHFRLC